MTSKKKTPTTPSTTPQSLRIGSRVRCNDDHVEGRIVWANGVSLKIRWDDGEQVTWRRDSLAERPIEILDAASDEIPHSALTASEQPVVESPIESAEPAPAPTEQHSKQPLTDPAPIETQPPDSADEAQKTTEQTGEQSDPTSFMTKQPGTRKSRRVTDDGKEKKLSALDAAAKTLGETDKPMSCQEMIETMAAKGYWTSPGGKTPAGTLYSAIAREITAKGTDSRFLKADRGKFARTSAT